MSQLTETTANFIQLKIKYRRQQPNGQLKHFLFFLSSFRQFFQNQTYTTQPELIQHKDVKKIGNSIFTTSIPTQLFKPKTSSTEMTILPKSTKMSIQLQS